MGNKAAKTKGDAAAGLKKSSVLPAESVQGRDNPPDDPQAPPEAEVPANAGEMSPGAAQSAEEKSAEVAAQEEQPPDQPPGADGAPASSEAEAMSFEGFVRRWTPATENAELPAVVRASDLTDDGSLEFKLLKHVLFPGGADDEVDPAAFEQRVAPMLAPGSHEETLRLLHSFLLSFAPENGENKAGEALAQCLKSTVGYAATGEAAALAMVSDADRFVEELRACPEVQVELDKVVTK